MADTFARMRQMIGTTAEWTANDLVIGNGEFAIERLSGGSSRMKVGDGVNKFSALPYFDPGVFSYVRLAGDTMTGPLVVPGVTVNAGGVNVTAGNSAFTAPVNLGAGATAAEPGNNDNTQRLATTHWVRGQMAGIITGLNYLGAWNAATNTPPLASGGLGVPTPERGDFYQVSVAGTTDLDGNNVWAAGDFVAFNGIAWQRIPQPLNFDQIVAGLGYTPADQADLAVLEADAIKRQIVDAAGDLIVGTAADTVARLARGTAGQVLSATAGGIAWQAPKGWQVISRIVTTAAQADVQFRNVAGAFNEWMLHFDVTPTTNGQDLLLQFYDASDVLDTTTGRYAVAVTGVVHTQTAGQSAGGLGSAGVGVTNAIFLDYPATNRFVGSLSGVRGRATFPNLAAARVQGVDFQSNYLSNDGTVFVAVSGSGYRQLAGAVSGLRLFFTSTTFAAGGAVTLLGA